MEPKQSTNLTSGDRYSSNPVMEPRGSEQASINQSQLSKEELEQFHALMHDLNLEIDKEALAVVVSLLRLNVSPDEVYSVLEQIKHVCGLFKKIKLKTQKFNSIDNNR